MERHKPGTVAIFVSCEDRELIDQIRANVTKKTGYPVSIKAVVSRAIQEMAGKR